MKEKVIGFSQRNNAVATMNDAGLIKVNGAGGGEQRTERTSE